MLEKKTNDSLTAGHSQDDTLCVIEDVDQDQGPGIGCGGGGAGVVEKSPSYKSSDSSSHSQFPFLQGGEEGALNQTNNCLISTPLSVVVCTTKSKSQSTKHNSQNSQQSDEMTGGFKSGESEDDEDGVSEDLWKNNRNKKRTRKNSLTNNNNDPLSFPPFDDDGDDDFEDEEEDSPKQSIHPPFQLDGLILHNGPIMNHPPSHPPHNPSPLPPVKLLDGSPSDFSINSEPPWCQANDESMTQFNMDISPVAPYPTILVGDDPMSLPDENVPEQIMQENSVQSADYSVDGENANLLPKKSATTTLQQNDCKDGKSAAAANNNGNPMDNNNPSTNDKKVTKENPNGTELDESNCDVKYVCPDGGYGWMVLFGSLIVNILIPGLIKSYGVLFIDFIEVFEATPASAAWIPALSYWLYSSMGPFASALAIRFSHRKVTILGGLLASAGLALSYFATSISYLYVSYGIIGGLGAGLAYPIGVFMVGDYFDKKRGLANGLCTSGSALGSIIIPPLLRVLLSAYGYRIAILIMAGIILNVCVGALFYDPVEKHLKRVLVPRLVTSVDPNTTGVITNNVQSQQAPKPSSKITNCIAIRGSDAVGGKREIAASLPIAIPMQNNHSDVRGDRRGSGSARRATFQIGIETPQGESWSLKSTDFGTSPLAARLMKEEVEGGVGHGSSPRMIHFFNRNRHNVQQSQGLSSLDSTSDVVGGDNNCNLVVAPPTTITTTTVPPVLVASGGQSRLNLTAIPEDDDNDNDQECSRSEHESMGGLMMMIPQSSEATSRNLDWKYFQEVPSVNQRLLRLSTGGNTSGLSRTLSVASNASTSSFHYVSTIHHGSLLSALQADQNIPEFASTLTLRSVRKSCCSDCFRCYCCCGGGGGGSNGGRCFRRKGNRQSGEEDETDIMNKESPETHLTTPPPPAKTKKHEYKKIIDLSLFKDGIYIIMLLSNSTTAVGYTNFIILLPAYAMRLGIDKSGASYLLSVVAGFDFIGRIGGAALSDLRFISRKWFYIVGLFLSGVSLTLLPMATTYKALFIYCACFGLASGTYIGVTAVILADELGSEKLGSSYGITLFVNGVFQLAGPPICGILLEKTGKFQPILMALGIILVIGSLFWIAAPFIEHRRRVKAKNELLATVNHIKYPCPSSPELKLTNMCIV